MEETKVEEPRAVEVVPTVEVKAPEEPKKELAPSGATIGEKAEEPSEEIFVYATNPQEMLSAQARLIAWADRKLSDETAEYKDLDTNYQTAVKNKWRTTALKKASDRAMERVQFYEKVKAALVAGYCIVPNFPGNVFAVRTIKKTMPKKQETVQRTWGTPGSDITEVESDRPALGQGKYVSKDAAYRQETILLRHEAGKQPEYGTKFVREGFREVDFPFKLAKPAILDATAKAMALKIFDEVVAVRNQNLEPRRPRKSYSGDPMVIGRIYTKNGYNRHVISFLVAWFIDTRDL